MRPLWRILFDRTSRMSYCLREIAERGSMTAGEFNRLRHQVGRIRFIDDKPDRKYDIAQQRMSHWRTYEVPAWPHLDDEYLHRDDHDWIRPQLLDEAHCLVVTERADRANAFLFTWHGPTVAQLCAPHPAPRPANPRLPDVALPAYIAIDRDYAITSMERLLCANEPVTTAHAARWLGYLTTASPTAQPSRTS